MATAERERILLRIPEACDALGLSRTKLYELLAAGEIRSVKIGRSVRIPARALEEFAARLELEQGYAE